MVEHLLPKILVVDDERNVHYSFRRLLGNEYEVSSAFSGEEALSQVTKDPPHLVLLDIHLGGQDGLDTLRKLKTLRPELPVIIMTAFGTAETAIRATKFDAEEYILKPFDVRAFKQLITETLKRRAVSLPERDEGLAINEALPILGQSRPMQDVYRIVGRAATRDVTVLITGESGTGKELVARAIHMYSRREKGPFTAVNCAAIPETLLESEFFGYERGAFSGATEAHPGKFEQVHGGTLFLDEIGDMPLVLQSKLLRVLQDHEIYRLGAREPRAVDVRIITATNQDLEALVASGRFREDLYYRLNVVRITLPPLRERSKDILLLADYFLNVHRRSARIPINGFTPEAQSKLFSYPWPGNVRELENVIAQAVLHTRGPFISAEDLQLTLVPPSISHPELSASEDSLDRAIEQVLAQKAGSVFAEVECLLVKKALTLARHNQVQAAKLLGVSRNVLRHRMKHYRLA
jgi:DNA-binding NtrC family response regulator